MNEVKEQIKQFNEERDWDQFHSPENLAKSISIEAGELLECFQWNNNFDKDEVCEELADVVNYCILLADKLDVELDDIIFQAEFSVFEQSEKDIFIPEHKLLFTGDAAISMIWMFLKESTSKEVYINMLFERAYLNTKNSHCSILI